MEHVFLIILSLSPCFSLPLGTSKGFYILHLLSSDHKMKSESATSWFVLYAYVPNDSTAIPVFSIQYLLYFSHVKLDCNFICKAKRLSRIRNTKWRNEIRKSHDIPVNQESMFLRRSHKFHNRRNYPDYWPRFLRYM